MRFIVRTALVAVSLFSYSTVFGASVEEGLAAYAQGDYETAMANCQPLADEGDLSFEEDPGLSFTRILSDSVNDSKPQKENWAGLLVKVIGVVKAKRFSGEKLVNELQVPARASEYTMDGYKFFPDLGISVQGQSATDAWKDVSRLADRFRIPVEVRFQWRDNQKAQHPGKIGVIRAGA